MPYRSKSQMRWGNSEAGHKALGDRGVDEWNQASKGLRLPDHAARQKETSKAFTSRIIKKTPRKHQAAVSELGNALHTITNNEPINRKEGDRKQANLEHRHAVSFRSAMLSLASLPDHVKNAASKVTRQKKRA